MDVFVQKALNRRRLGKTDPERYIFADALAAQTSDKLRIRSELLNILLAGRDTTASVLSNAVDIIARRQDVLAELYAEVERVVGREAPPTYEQLKDMKLLRAVLNESQRLYPVVVVNFREALVDTTLPRGGGPEGKQPVFVPKGTMVNWNLWAMHRRKDLFGEDAEEFKPERWLDREGKQGLRVAWEYLPFNGGPRMCLGREYYFGSKCIPSLAPRQFIRSLSTT